MPIFTSQAIGSVKGLGFTSSSAKYFIAYYNTTTAQVLKYPVTIAATSSGFVYLSSQTGSATDAPTTVGINSNGSLAFQNRYGTVYGQSFNGVIDSAGNLITVGANATAATANAIFKYTSSGTFTGYGANNGTSNSGNFNSWIDSSGNIHIIGLNGNATFGTIYYKYNSAFSLSAQYSFNVSGNSVVGVGVSGDSSGNIYLTGYHTLSSVYYIFLIKLDSTGAIVWQYKYATANTPTMGYQNLAVDSSGNVYMVISLSTGEPMLVKLDSSGTVQWNKKITTSGSGVYVSSLQIDSSSTYLYVGALGGPTQNAALMFKYDTSGNFQWGRSLSIGTTGATAAFTNINSFACYYVLNVPVSSVAKNIIGCFPLDGSKTGTYSLSGLTFTYASVTPTESSPTITQTTFNAVKTTPSFASSAISLTAVASAATLTSTII